MTVKWHGQTSTTRDVPWGGPQGCTLGLLEYKSFSNNSADQVPSDMKFRFVDDLSLLEKLNLILFGLCSYNFRNHVASDVGTNQKYLPSENYQSQQYINQIEQWTNIIRARLRWLQIKVKQAGAELGKAQYKVGKLMSSASCKASLMSSSMRLSSIEVVFHWVRLQLWLSSIVVIFLWSSSIVVVFHWGRLPLRSSSI